MRGLLFGVILCLCFCCSAFDVYAVDLTASWSHDGGPKVAGFRLYKTTDVRRGKGHYIVGSGNETVDILASERSVRFSVPSQDWNFAITAYGIDGIESGLSNEAVYTHFVWVPPVPPPIADKPIQPPGNFRVTQ